MKTALNSYLSSRWYIQFYKIRKPIHMKTTLLFTCLLCMLDFSGYAQGDFSAHIHIAPPSTIFGGGDPDDFYGLIDSDDPYGYSGLGFGVGFEYHHPFGENGLSGLVSCDIFRNGIKRTYKEEYKKELDIDAEYFSFDYKVKFSAYYNIPILVGVNYDFTVMDVPLFVQGGPLLDILKVSNTRRTYTYSNNEPNVNRDTYALSVAFGYGVRVGITLAEKYILSIGYKSLGTHSFSNTSYDSWGEDYQSSSTDTEVKKIGLINLSFGIQL